MLPRCLPLLTLALLAACSGPPLPLPATARATAIQAPSFPWDIAAESCHARARQAWAKADLPLTRLSVEATLAIHPNHPGARELENLLDGIDALRDVPLRALQIFLKDREETKMLENVIRLEKILEKADEDLEARCFSEALNGYDTVEVNLRVFPYRWDWGDLLKRIVMRKRQARELMRRRDRERRQR